MLRGVDAVRREVIRPEDELETGHVEETSAFVSSSHLHLQVISLFMWASLFSLSGLFIYSFVGDTHREETAS